VAIERINPDSIASPVEGLYAQVVVASGTRRVHIAGQVAIDRDGNLVGPGDYKSQATQAWANVKAAIHAVGGTGHDITNYTIAVVNHEPHLVEVIYGAGMQVFGDEFPRAAAILVGVQCLGYPEWLIEIEADGVLD
jgi:enamine deaminase RidA (YjgF/YER057c/UK114 family)